MKPIMLGGGPKIYPGNNWPNCSKDKCLNKICLWLSDRFCYPHSLDSVKEYDKKKEPVKAEA